MTKTTADSNVPERKPNIKDEDEKNNDIVSISKIKEGIIVTN